MALSPRRLPAHQGARILALSPCRLLRIKAPKKAVGELDTTFLDNELRIGRGDKGNLFVLFKDDVFTPAAA